MDWKNIATHVADAAPLLGSLLGGPAGAQVGGWIAKAFGTAGGKPEDVLKAMQNDQEWAYKLRSLEVQRERDILQLQQQLAIQELTGALETVKSVNTTMQTEASSDKWWVSGWRPFWGFISGTAFLFVTLLVCHLMYLGVISKDQEAMRSIPDLVSSFTLLFGIPGAILGIASWGRNQLKLEQLKGSK